MRSTRSRKRKLGSSKENNCTTSKLEETGKAENIQRTQSFQESLDNLSASSSQRLETVKTASYEGTEATQQVLEQQKKRIEQLEKALRDTKIEMERLRLYNRQLALGLTSLQSANSPNNHTLSSLSGLVQPEGSEYKIENSTGGNLNSTNDCRHTPSDTGLISTFHAFGDNQEVNAETASKGGSSTQSRYWTADEHKRFLEGLARFGHKDMKAIARFVGTRNATQVRTHAQKYYLKLAREAAKRQANQYKRFASEDSVPYLVEQRRRSRNDSDFLFPVDNSDSSEMECRVVTSKHLTSNNFQDEKEANSNSRFEVANLHMMDFGQDSSFGEVSVTSEGLSECKSVCNDHFSPISFYDVEGADAFNKEETCIYGLLHRDKNEQATNVSSQSSVDT